jgi:hypothetical protein
MGEKIEENLGKVGGAAQFVSPAMFMVGDEATQILGGEGGEAQRQKLVGKVIGEKNVQWMDLAGDVATGVAAGGVASPALAAGAQAANSLMSAAASDILTGGVNWGETLATTAISAGAGVAAAGAGSLARATYLGGAGAVNEFLRGNDWEQALVAGASGAAGGYFDLGVAGSALLGAGTTEAMIAVGDYDAEQEKRMRLAGYGSALMTAALNYGTEHVIAHNEGRQPRDLGVLKGPERRNPNRGFQQGKYVREARARRAGKAVAADVNKRFESQMIGGG